MHVVSRLNPKHAREPRASSSLWRTILAVSLVMSVLLGSALTAVSCGERPLRTTSVTQAASWTTLSSTTTTLPGQGDWPLYHHDSARSGLSSDQEPLGEVRQEWVSAELDGELIYAQPLLVGETLLVATEGNTVFALDAASGEFIWGTYLGPPVLGESLPCGNIDPSGITGTPVIDTETGTVFVVAFLREGPHHELFALDLETGEVYWSREIDPPGLSPEVEQQRGALALVNDMVYVPYGGMSGDCGEYRGAVVAAQADGQGELVSYIVPTERMGGIWNPTGLLVDERGDLWLATGNTESLSIFDYGNSVIRLSPGLEVLDYFAPEDWVRLNKRDLDINTIAPVLLAGERILAVGKTGIAYLLDASDLGQVGEALATVDVDDRPFGTAVALDSRVFVPCDGSLVAVDVLPAGLEIAWRHKGGVGSPIIAAGHVWALGRDGKLRVYEPADGSVVFEVKLSKPASRFITLSAANGRVFVADGERILALSMR